LLLREGPGREGGWVEDHGCIKRGGGKLSTLRGVNRLEGRYKEGVIHAQVTPTKGGGIYQRGSNKGTKGG